MFKDRWKSGKGIGWKERERVLRVIEIGRKRNRNRKRKRKRKKKRMQER
jgi:hypothetical protein